MDTYQQLKAKVKELQSKAERSQGALGQLMQQLEDEFNCTTLKAADALLSEYEEIETNAEAKYKKLLKEFEESWGELLGEDGEESDESDETEGGRVRRTLRRSNLSKGSAARRSRRG